MKPIDLSNHLRTYLAADLGKYANGELALWLNEYDVPASYGRVTGIQCVIQPVMSINTITPTTGRVFHVEGYLVVELVQFDRGASLAVVLEKLRSAFVTLPPVWVPRTQISFERATVKIFNPGFTK